MTQNNQTCATNYLYIWQLLERGEKQLHRIFRERWSIYHNIDYSIPEWKDNESCGAELLMLCISISKAQKEILKLGKVNSWDISLAFSAIHGVSKEIRNYGGFLNVNEDRLILELKNERNKHAHRRLNISDEEFARAWQTLSNILIQLGDDLVQIEAIKSNLGESKLSLAGSLNKYKLKFMNAEIMPNQIRQVFSNQPVLSLKELVFEDTALKDYKQVVEHFTKAANDGMPEGMFYLAMLYENGKGVECNEKESLKWLLKAATAKEGKEIVEAQYSLGLKYYAGSGVTRNPEKAAEWFQKAVENGCEASANNLGVLYKYGEGVVQSAQKAFYFFKLAAERGDITAMQNLAHCYFTTQGTDVSNLTEEHMNEGLKWMEITESKSNKTAVNEEKNICITEATNLLNKRKYFNEIIEAAKKGSQTAQKVLSIWKYMDEAVIAFEKNDQLNLITSLSKAIRFDYQIVKIPEEFKTIIEERIKTNESDLDTIVCFVQLNINSPNFPVYVVKYLNQYRFDQYLFEMLICCFMELGEIEAGLHFAESAVKTWPDSLRFSYCYALALCKQDNPTIQAVAALDTFLADAPPDHENVPSCHFHKAKYYTSVKNNEKFVESYEAAKDAEKRQLPCFLPVKK